MTRPSICDVPIHEPAPVGAENCEPTELGGTQGLSILVKDRIAGT
jgi:hypothetical protein